MTGTATDAASEAKPLRYRRILLKLSGEALLGDRQYGVDPAVCVFIARQVAEVHGLGVQIGIVVGGGNIFRGLAASARGMDRATGDYIGMLATVMNGLALQDALERAGVPTRVMTAIAMNEVAEPYIRRRADPPPREGPRHALRGGHRQSVLHDRHGGRPARRRDRRRGPAQGDQGRRRLRHRPDDAPGRAALRLVSDTRTCCATSSRSSTRRP